MPRSWHRATSPFCSLVSPALPPPAQRNGVDADPASDPLSVRCFADRALGVLTPSAGPVGGGTPFTIGGAFPLGPATCRLGAMLLPGTATASGVACASTPPLSPAALHISATQPVQISLNGQDYSPPLADAPRFTFYQSPYVQRIRPTAGPVHGGTVITLEGLRLHAGGWASPSTVAIAIGSGTPNATGELPEGLQPLNATAVEPYGRAVVTSPTVPPASGCALRCCVLAADGRTVEACDAARMAVADAAGAAASCAPCAATLSLALNGRDWETPQRPPAVFTFYNATTLHFSAVHPRSGPVGGGTSVTLHGVGLTPAGAAAEGARCGFGVGAQRQSVRIARADPAGMWVACAPTAAFNLTGDVTALAVSVAPNGVDFEGAEGDTAGDHVAFYVYAEPQLSATLPNGGPTAGGTTVLVQGAGLAPGNHTDAALARCRFGRREDAIVNVSAIDALGVRCHPSPPTELYAIGVDKGLQVSLNGQQFGAPADGDRALGLPFRYYTQLELSRIWPTGGPASGGSPLTLYGAGFDRYAAEGAGTATSLASEGDGAPLCIFGGSCYDEHGVHRGVRCALPPRVTGAGVGPHGAMAATADVRSAAVAICAAPPLLPALLPRAGSRGRVSVRVALALNAQNFVHARSPLYVFYSGVTVNDLAPSRGPPLGGVHVRVSGTQLHVFGERADARCRFDGWAPRVPSAALGMGHVAARTVDVAPLYKGEEHFVCLTPPFPAGSVAVQISLNGRDFHGADPPLTHALVCEQHDPRHEQPCVASASCGYCRDELPPTGVDHTPWGVTQDRIGCVECHADGCAAGPAEGSCRLWTYAARLLEPPADAVEAAGLVVADIDAPSAGNTRASARGTLLPNQMRYYRIRPRSNQSRLLVTLAFAPPDDVLLFARRGALPGADRSDHDLAAAEVGSPRTLVIGSGQIRCGADADASHYDAAHDVDATGVDRVTAPFDGDPAALLCDEWVLGVLGSGYQPRYLIGELGPQARSSAFELHVRLEPDATEFGCAACAHDCAACGWAALQAAQYVRDDSGADVVRLTNDTHQVGALWLAQPQPYATGFETSFAFRISGQSVCTHPLELFGANRSAAASHPPADGSPMPEFTPYEDLEEAGDEITHYLIDHPSLPFDAVPPPRGVAPQIAAESGQRADLDARYGVFKRTPASGLHTPYLSARGLGCPEGVERVGGEGFAFVLQAEGLEAAGCAGTGVGYAAAPNCTRPGIARSVAVQFDTHHHARTVRTERCNDYDAAGLCRPGALRVRDSLVVERKHAISVFAAGNNSDSASLVTAFLGPMPPLRFDDAVEHTARITYRPPVGSETHGQLHLFLDGSDVVALSLPLNLHALLTGSPAGSGAAAASPIVAANTSTGPATPATPGAANTSAPAGDSVGANDGAAGAVAYVGFTASTGEASEYHDIRRFSFCHRLGCSVR